MNKKPYILLVFLFLVSIPISAQVDADISHPSINAEQFGFALKAETALNKGQLSVDIPLMELQGKGYNLPISLTFYSGDVNACTEASPIGLGWALNAGGVIAATIKGAEDIEDYVYNGNNDHHTDAEYIEKAIRDIQCFSLLDRIRENSMPDEYTYSLPGHSGTIEISLDKNNTIKKTLFPDESYKIEDTQNGYCITADDGTKFYFEASERRIIGTNPESQISTSYFLTSIKTVKGGEFIFHYADEDYFDLSMIRDAKKVFDMYHTKRITKIESVGFGYITFGATDRNDRGDIGHWTINKDYKSMRINKIELRDKEGTLIKGYELDNSDTFKLYETQNEDPDDSWYNHRLKLSSITQYDAVGNQLPPYKFTYDYSLSKSYLQSYHNITSDDETPYDSWTSNGGSQVHIDLTGSGAPYCSICNDCPNSWPTGWIEDNENYQGAIANDYFCLSIIDYPNGARDVYDYEPHQYGKINNSDSYYSTNVQGLRISMKKHYGSGTRQATRYVYARHDSNHSIIEGSSSGVLTNPSIHHATYYTPVEVETAIWGGRRWYLRASRITSGKPFNSFMGPPVCYTEVEEVEIGEYDHEILSRTIHYFEPQIVSPPVNYVFYYPRMELIKIDNHIYGKKTGYSHGMEVTNDINHCYIAYPVGEFCNTSVIVDKPLKEVFIGKNDTLRSIKSYEYSSADWNMEKKYGYKIVSPSNADYALISKSEYFIRRTRLIGTTTTSYFYDKNGVRSDSIYEESFTSYNKGRIANTQYARGYDMNNREYKISQYYFPDNITDIMGNGSSSDIVAVRELIEKNMIAVPIKTVTKRNNKTVGGECRNYQMLSDKPLLKSLYKIKNTENNYSNETPTITDNAINYRADLYKEGDILTYDSYYNPEHVRLHDSQDRYYVWGYGGRFPIAVIDNIDDAAFASLKTRILQLETYTKIETAEDCARLKNTNADIRNNTVLPASAHITTYTYDPNFGMTSEMDDSNLGTIYTYDTFGRLFAVYDENYRKKEEYNYHYKLQQTQ